MNKKYIIPTACVVVVFLVLTLSSGEYLSKVKNAAASVLGLSTTAVVSKEDETTTETKETIDTREDTGTVITKKETMTEDAKKLTEAVTVAPAITFPSDHGAHTSFNAEWWYLNLFLKTKKLNGTSQKDLGYVLSFSRLAGSKGLLSSRFDKTTNAFAEKTDVGGTFSVSLRNNKYLLVEYVNGSATTMKLEEQAPGSDKKKVYRLTGKTAQVGTFDLTLKERTVPSGGSTPLLWGGTTGSCTGKISVFSADDTFYYSIPDLDVTGTITDIDGTVRNVTAGESWFDHQWFNGMPPSTWKGHYWANFQYKTGSGDVYGSGAHQAVGFVTQIYTTGPKYTYWVKRNSNGTNECGTSGTMTINSYGASGFPATWKLELKKTAPVFLTANGTSYSDKQIYTPPFGPKFIEAESSFTGTVDGSPFTGVGFFETHRKSGM